MKRVGAVLAGLVCLASADARADLNSPLIDGDYQVGSFGVLRLTSTAAASAQNKIERFAVRGTYVRGDKCGFAPSEVLVEGVTEGTVLIATFTTCVEGSGCQSPSKLSLMAVMSEGLLAGYISLPKGCEAKGLEQRVTMELAPRTLREAALSFMQATPPNFGRAAAAWKRLSELPEYRDDVDVLLQLGSTLNGMKDYQEGKRVFERALRHPAFAGSSGETRTMVLYNLACSESGLSEKDPTQASLALDHLKQAVETGRANRLNVAKYATEDGDLAPIRSMPEFQKLFGLGRKGPR